MKCSACGASKLVQKTFDLPYTYKGKSTIVPNVTGHLCSSCGESVLTLSESARISIAMLDFNKQVNADLADPFFIMRVRKQLKLDKKEAGKLFGGGNNAFSRYENGKTKPPLALLKLLALLEKHPELLNEVRAA